MSESSGLRHGFAAAAASLFEAVEIAVHLPANAAILTTALQFGDPILLSDGEIEALCGMDRRNPNARTWDYWRTRAGLSRIRTDQRMSVRQR